MEKAPFGECSWVEHRTTKKKRVVKSIKKEAASVPSEEMTAELDTMKMLDHPNIVKVYEWFVSDEAFLLVLEPAYGGDVKHVLQNARADVPPGQPGGIDEPLVANLTKQSLQALNYVHSKHIIHRDIKPANMLLASTDLEKPRLLLADFGVAELFVGEMVTGAMVRGTVAYMAPEVFTQTNVGPRTDVWALGVTSYELLCGQRPFVAENPMALYAQLKKKEVSYDVVSQVGASDGTVAFLGRMLAKKLEERSLSGDLLSDPWITSHALEMQHDARPVGRAARKIREGMRAYSRKSHFSRASLNCIAAQLETSRIEELASLFKSWDVDHDGVLSTAELAAGLAEVGVDADSIQQLVYMSDMNNDNVIQYSEFVASLLASQAKLTHDVIFHAFQVIDVNNDGVISLDELRLMLSGDGPLTALVPEGKTVEQVLAEVDTSHDGRISFEEFKAYLMGHDQDHQDDSAMRSEVFDDTPLEAVMRDLCEVVGRPEAELVAQATRLLEQHWMGKVADLRALTQSDWPRLGLPLKLERVLRTYIGA